MSNNIAQTLVGAATDTLQQLVADTLARGVHLGTIAGQLVEIDALIQLLEQRRRELQKEQDRLMASNGVQLALPPARPPVDDVSKWPPLQRPVSTLGLSDRPATCLDRYWRYLHQDADEVPEMTVADLVDMTEDDLLRITNFGMKSLDEVIYKLDELNLSLKVERTLSPEEAATPVEDLDLRTQIKTRLLNGGVDTLGKLLGCTDEGLKGIDRIGPVAVREIDAMLAKRDLRRKQ